MAGTPETPAVPAPDPMNYDLGELVKETVRHLLGKDFSTKDYPTDENEVLFVGFSIQRQGAQAIVKRVRFRHQQPQLWTPGRRN